jgi:hypothetical protein
MFYSGLHCFSSLLHLHSFIYCQYMLKLHFLSMNINTFTPAYIYRSLVHLNSSYTKASLREWLYFSWNKATYHTVTTWCVDGVPSNNRMINYIVYPEIMAINARVKFLVYSSVPLLEKGTKMVIRMVGNTFIKL